MLPNLGPNGLFEGGDRGAYAASDASTGDDGAEAFDGIDPKGGRQSEVEDRAIVIGQPLLDV